MIILEGGINHFGKIRLANKILKLFLNSSSKHLTFMIHTSNFNDSFRKKGINFELPVSFYKKALSLAHKRKKFIGLSVCDLNSFKKYSDINFDFYKLLSIAINNKKLINFLKARNKEMFISLAKGSNKNINNCLNLFKPLKKINLIYTSMSYNNLDLKLDRIKDLKKIYNYKVGYGHHHNSKLPIYLSRYFKPDFYFIYVKPEYKSGRVYPDNDHAFFFDELKKINIGIKETDEILESKKLKTKIKLNAKKIRL